ncbi:MAG: O-antigen ligase family protein [Syntrophobacteraceae bacterium]
MAINLVLVGLLLVAALASSAVKRELLVFWLLLIASQLFGIFHEYSFGLLGWFDINSMLVLICMFTIMLSLGNLGELRQSCFAVYFIFLFGFWAYGVILPTLAGWSSFYYCVRESKEYLNYIAYLSVFLFIKDLKQVKNCFRFMIFFAAYFTALELLPIFLGIRSVGWLQYAYRPEQVFLTKIYIPIFTIMVFVLLYKFFYSLNNETNIKYTLSLSFYVIGVLLSFYRAYILATVFSVGAVLVTLRRVRETFYFTASAVVTLLLAIFIIFSVTPSYSFSKMVDSFFASGIYELYTGKGGSLGARKTATKGRLKLIEEKLWTGWGFLNANSEGGRKLKQAVGRTASGSIAFVDKGYVDVAGKFGVIGAVGFYGVFVLLFMKLLRIARRVDKSDPGQKELLSRLYACAALLVVFLCVQLTHAPLTRQFGILPLAMILGLLDRQLLLTSLSQERKEGSADGRASLARLALPGRIGRKALKDAS